MATQANTISPADSQSLGVTAVARSIRGGPAVSFQITIPTKTGSQLVEVRRSTLEDFISSAIDALNDADGDCDLEEDDPQGDTTEDEPAFDAKSRALANMKGSTGPGCTISDVDHGAEEGGEQDEGWYGHTCQYGLDQTKPVGPDNPILR